MNLNDNLTRIILGIITALITAGVVFKFVSNRKINKDSGSVNIRNSKIKGDVAGRDIKK
jgi:hypothetical protein